MKWTKEKLIDFETKLKDEFLAGNIKAPVHLSGGNEEELIDIFDNHVNEYDWVFSTWRNHYHALLHGVSPKYVFNECMNSNSIAIQCPEKNFYTSAIVGGIAPIAVGVALSLKLSGSKHKVCCFLGDMASTIGIVHESMKYAQRNNLPITFIIEENGFSVDTPVAESWGTSGVDTDGKAKVIHYVYERVYPHVGSGEWVTF